MENSFCACFCIVVDDSRGLRRLHTFPGSQRNLSDSTWSYKIEQDSTIFHMIQHDSGLVSGSGSRDSASASGTGSKNYGSVSGSRDSGSGDGMITKECSDIATE